MFDNNAQPLYADFNEMDDDRATVMGIPPFKDIYLQNTDFVPKEGAKVWISDGDIEERGTLKFRENRYWVLVQDENGTKSVPKDAWYHHDNLSKK
jgi:hypothetical protein